MLNIILQNANPKYSQQILEFFGGILYRAVAFLEFGFLIVLLISLVFAVGTSNLTLRFSVVFLIFIMLLCYRCY